MTQITPKLGLLLYDIGVPDNQQTFLQFRSDIAGVSDSNFTKIDDAVADIDNRLTSVENLKPIVKLEGITSDGINYVATSPSVTTLYDGFIIDFIPNQDNTGTATLTINDEYISTINKVNASGITINLEARDLIALHRYILEYNGSEWILVNSTSADQVNVNGTPSSILVVDVDNSITASSISVVDNKISGDNIKTNPTDIFSDNGALSLTDTLSETGIYKGIEWDSTGRAVNVATNKVLPSDISLDASLTDNSGALGLSLTGIIPGVYKGIEYDATGRALNSSGKVAATEINHSARLADTGIDNVVLDLSPTGITAGIYKGLTLDEYGRVIGTNNLVRGDEISIDNSLISTEGVLGVSKAPDSDKLGGQPPSYYLPATGKAADSDKLDGVDGTGYVNTSADQTIAGVKTFSSIPVLPSTNPTLTNHAVRKGYADATYLNISAKAADSNLLDGLDSTAFVQISDLGVWSSWTPTQTGWTALPTGVYRYCKIGKLVMGIIYMSAGTSNSTVAQLSLPFTSANNGSSMRGTVGYVIDNGLTQTQPGAWVIFGNATVINFYKTFPEGTWTASGTKRIITVFFYEAA